MRIIHTSYYCLLISLLAFSNTEAQNRFSVHLKFPTSVQPSQIKVFYDDGINDNILVEDTIIQNQLNISKPYYSQFATLMVGFGGRAHKLWLTEKTALISFEIDSVGLKIVSLQNAIDVDKSKPAQEMNKFVSADVKNIETFLANNNTWYTKDSLVAIYQGLNKKLSAKKVDFVRQNPNSYYAFWLFRRELVYFDYNVVDLTSLYDRAFAPKLKTTREGSEIRLRLTGRAIKKGKKSVDFATNDINGNKLKLQDYQGKLVLITFWASWCGPCIEEFPKIKELKASYPSDSLAFIFISLDVDQKKFESALNKYDLPGVQIRNDIEILKKYGVMAIPQVYLIDKKGYIIYSRADQLDPNLDGLSKVLASNLTVNK